ncbi:hypothetical protein A2U01_0114385, partial [Trifolium medium]|nr:hypothetical protein [Trifolium medium]
HRTHSRVAPTTEGQTALEPYHCALRQNKLRVAQITEAKLPSQHELRVTQDASARCARYSK